jgi:murein DD-endopeptidase MepM/ murein hydrolase activator NlpD
MALLLGGGFWPDEDAMKAIPLVAMFLLMLVLVGVGGSQSNQKTSQKRLQNQLKDVRNQKAQTQRQLRQTRREANAVVDDIEQVDSRLDTLETQLNDTTTRLTQSRNRQERLTLELQLAQQRLELRKEQVRQRLRRMYVRGESTFLSVLAGTESTGDLASRKYLFDRIAAKDRSVFEGYRQLRDTVSERLDEQQTLTVQIDDLKRRQEGQQDDLEQTKAEKREKLSSLRTKQAELMKMLRQFQADESRIEAQIAAYSRRPGMKKLPKFTGRFGRPVNGPITSNYGMRFHPILRVRRMHSGIDFGARSGTPIFSVANGVVISATYMRGYGNTVIVDHGGGISTVYAHCSAILVRSGQSVTRGQTIARVGSTGLSTGPHLHFEVRVQGRAVNPRGWL